MTVATDLDQLAIDTIRTLSIDGVQKANSGHPGAPMGAAPMAYVLWTRFLRHAPTHPDWPDRDRFVLCAGHASMLLYSLLHLTGYEVSLEDLESFRQWGSITPGHPEYGPDARRRGDDRPARPGLRQRGRDGHRRATPGGRVQPTRPRDRRPPDLRHRLATATSRRGSPPRRPAWPATCGSASSIVLYDDNRIQLDGPTAMAWSRGCPGAVRCLRLAYPAGRGRQRPRRHRGRHRGRPAPTIGRASSPSGRTSATAARTSRTARRRTARRSGPTRSA